MFTLQFQEEAMGKHSKTGMPPVSPQGQGKGNTQSPKGTPRSADKDSRSSVWRRRNKNVKLQKETVPEKYHPKVNQCKRPVDLHWVETWLYILGWTGAALYSVYNVFYISGGKDLH